MNALRERQNLSKSLCCEHLNKASKVLPQPILYIPIYLIRSPSLQDTRHRLRKGSSGHQPPWLKRTSTLLWLIWGCPMTKFQTWPKQLAVQQPNNRLLHVNNPNTSVCWGEQGEERQRAVLAWTKHCRELQAEGWNFHIPLLIQPKRKRNQEVKNCVARLPVPLPTLSVTPLPKHGHHHPARTAAEMGGRPLLKDWPSQSSS